MSYVPKKNELDDIDINVELSTVILPKDTALTSTKDLIQNMKLFSAHGNYNYEDYLIDSFSGIGFSFKNEKRGVPLNFSGIVNTPKFYDMINLYDSFKHSTTANVKEISKCIVKSKLYDDNYLNDRLKEMYQQTFDNITSKKEFYKMQKSRYSELLNKYSSINKSLQSNNSSSEKTILFYYSNILDTLPNTDEYIKYCNEKYNTDIDLQLNINQLEEITYPDKRLFLLSVTEINTTKLTKIIDLLENDTSKYFEQFETQLNQIYDSLITVQRNLDIIEEDSFEVQIDLKENENQNVSYFSDFVC